MYFTSSKYGIASSGRWLFRNRRCVCASMRSCMTSAGSKKRASIHGVMAMNSPGRGPGPKIIRLTMRCVHVVPAL
jgi:hypothetical protein